MRRSSLENRLGSDRRAERIRGSTPEDPNRRMRGAGLFILELSLACPATSTSTMRGWAWKQGSQVRPSRETERRHPGASARRHPASSWMRWRVQNVENGVKSAILASTAGLHAGFHAASRTMLCRLRLRGINSRFNNQPDLVITSFWSSQVFINQSRAFVHYLSARAKASTVSRSLSLCSAPTA